MVTKGRTQNTTIFALRALICVTSFSLSSIKEHSQITGNLRMLPKMLKFYPKGRDFFRRQNYILMCVEKFLKNESEFWRQVNCITIQRRVLFLVSR